MDAVNYKTSKNTCTFCQTSIKSEIETFYCPSCNSPYHRDCWMENKGCAVYGCGEKDHSGEDYSSLRESIINIEYLINRNQYAEAIYEAKQCLKIDRRNAELKNLYNKAVALINNKINLMTSADDAFGKKDYKAAEIYYKNVLSYTDEIETNFVNTRLEIAKEKIPDQKRRRIYQNILIIILILAILSALGYLGYYTFILKEDRDFAELVKSDNAGDLASMEKMISKYESFLRTYSNGKKKQQVIGRMNAYSYKIASTYYKDDWRLALKHFNRIANVIDSADAKTTFNNIYNVAYNDYKQKLANARKLNSVYKYGEALNELQNAKLIISSFPKESISKESALLESNINLLNKKISSIVKFNDLEREIRDQNKQLNNISSSGTRDAILITLKVERSVKPGLYVGKDINSGMTIAVDSHLKKFREGEVLNIDCVPEGKVQIKDEDNKEMSLPLYSRLEADASDILISTDERSAIIERMDNLKSQKTKLDTLLKQPLL